MFAELYHAHHSLHIEDLTFWQDLVSQQGGPVLELGCGTGRVFQPLFDAGLEIYGLDSDAEMLAFLRERMGHQSLPIFQADMAAFHLAQKFPLIILPCNTFSTLDAKSRASTLACVARHLMPDGLFVVSMPNPALLNDLPRASEPELEEQFSHPQDGEIVYVSSGWRKAKKSLTFIWQYDHLLPDGRLQRLMAEVRHSLQDADAYRAEFAAAGLKVMASYGDYDRSPCDDESPYFILVVQFWGSV